MSRYHLKRLFQFLVPTLLAFSVLFAAFSPSLAQSTSTGGATSDDSDDLPVYINITGYVQELTATGLKINDQTIIIPAGMTLPAGIVVGKVASLRGNLRNDDTIIIIIIAPGYHLPTVSPTPVATAVGTPPGTPMPTMAATEPEGTEAPPGTPVAGCNKPGQKLALMLSAAYAIPYQQIADLHCKGYHYGEIARAYLLVITGDDEGKNITVPVVLDLRGKHHRWSEIIIILAVQPDSSLIIFVIDGGHATFFVDCGGKDNHKQSRYCVRVSPGGNNGGGNNQGGKGKGKGGDDDD